MTKDTYKNQVKDKEDTERQNEERYGAILDSLENILGQTLIKPKRKEIGYLIQNVELVIGDYIVKQIDMQRLKDMSHPVKRKSIDYLGKKMDLCK